jgi:hypothetical protein
MYKFYNPASEPGESTRQLNMFAYICSFAFLGPNGLPSPGRPRVSNEMPLLEALHDNQERDSSDPKDKVFALLGIVDLKSYCRNTLRVDYKASLAQVYVGLSKQ